MARYCKQMGEFRRSYPFVPNHLFVIYRQLTSIFQVEYCSGGMFKSKVSKPLLRIPATSLETNWNEIIQ